jgi:twitching motility protein PilT
MSGHEEAPGSKPAAGIRLGTKKEDFPVNKYFRALIELNGSDLHMQVGKPAILRIKGSLQPLDMPPIDEELMRELCFPLMDERNQKIFADTGGADFAHVVEYKGEPWRFRVNLFIQMSKMGMVTRKVERSIPNFEGLFLPPVLESLCVYDQGMVLLAGVTGSGKCETAKLLKPPCMPRKPGTWYSEPSTLRRPLRQSVVSSTCSPRRCTALCVHQWAST